MQTENDLELDLPVQLDDIPVYDQHDAKAESSSSSSNMLVEKAAEEAHTLEFMGNKITEAEMATLTGSVPLNELQDRIQNLSMDDLEDEYVKNLTKGQLFHEREMQHESFEILKPRSEEGFRRLCQAMWLDSEYVLANDFAIHTLQDAANRVRTFADLIEYRTTMDQRFLNALLHNTSVEPVWNKDLSVRSLAAAYPLGCGKTYAACLLRYEKSEEWSLHVCPLTATHVRAANGERVRSEKPLTPGQPVLYWHQVKGASFPSLPKRWTMCGDTLAVRDEKGWRIMQLPGAGKMSVAMEHWADKVSMESSSSSSPPLTDEDDLVLANYEREYAVLFKRSSGADACHSIAVHRLPKMAYASAYTIFPPFKGTWYRLNAQVTTASICEEVPVACRPFLYPKSAETTTKEEEEGEDEEKKKNTKAPPPRYHWLVYGCKDGSFGQMILDVEEMRLLAAPTEEERSYNGWPTDEEELEQSKARTGKPLYESPPREPIEGLVLAPGSGHILCISRHNLLAVLRKGKLAAAVAKARRTPEVEDAFEKGDPEVPSKRPPLFPPPEGPIEALMPNASDEVIVVRDINVCSASITGNTVCLLTKNKMYRSEADEENKAKVRKEHWSYAIGFYALTSDAPFMHHKGTKTVSQLGIPHPQEDFEGFYPGAWSCSGRTCALFPNGVLTISMPLKSAEMKQLLDEIRRGTKDIEQNEQRRRTEGLSTAQH